VKPRVWAGIFFLVSAAVYSANMRVVGAGDCWAVRYVPVSILREGNLDLNEFPEVKFQVWDWTRGRKFRIPLQPVVAGIAAVPVFAAADLLGVPFTPVNIAYLGKGAATLCSAAAAACCLLLLWRLLPPAGAVLYTAVFAFGTCVWSVSSQDLWQHGLSHFLLTAALLCLFSASGRRSRAGLSGFFLAWAAVVRGMNIPLAAFLFLYLCLEYRDQVLPFVLWSLPALGYTLAFNFYYFGAPGNAIIGYALGKFSPAGAPGALAGLLFSPARGLLFFTPVFVFSFYGAWRGWSAPSPFRTLYRFLAAAAGAYVLFLSAWFMWWGGHCYGYRMLVDLVPILIVLMVPAWRLLSGSAGFRLLFAVLLAWSVFLQGAGALYYGDRWNGRRHIDRHPERLWWVRGGQIDYMLAKARERGWRVERRVLLPEGQRARPDRIPEGAGP